MKTTTPIHKKGNTSFLKKLLLVLAFFIPVLTADVSFANSQAELTTGCTNPDADNDVTCGVSDEEVVKYLEAEGYQVSCLTPEDGGSCNEIATTQYDYKTIVYIKDGKIVGYEDIA